MTVLVILVAILGAQGLLAAFELLVPFLAAAALTVLFAVIVNITLYFRLKKIDMATSLKAIE